MVEVKNLKFDEKPNYEGLRNMFKELFMKKEYKYDQKYDWVKTKDPSKKMKSKSKRKRRE